MIAVLLGTQDSPFTRILEQLDAAIDKLGITETIEVQAGFTQYASERMHVVDYFSDADYEKIIKDADLIICHGGVGTIFSALHLNKPVIAMARNADYGEHNDNHQEEIVSKLASEGYILDAHNDLVRAIKKSRNFKPKKYETKNTITDVIEIYIDEL